MMIREFFLLFIFICSALFFTLAESFNTRLLDTPSGRIVGEVIFQNGIPVDTYLGIPYVKPPLGEFRFKRPVPAEPWNTTLQAKAMRPGCVQYSSNPFPWLDDLPGLSEDCLYLNVWVPVNANTLNRKTVMFWIHTGGFRISSSKVDFYNGAVLAAEGDVVVVTTNYRLGPQGFLYSGTEDAPGNMGLLDLVEALKWVRSNIESFGGDKDSITLFGHSSGGIAIGMFCASPITRGLFKRAIMQSGSPTILDGEDNDRSFRISQKLAETVGCADDKSLTLRNYPESIVKCLRNIDAFELSKTLSDITANDSRSFYPIFGDELLPKNPRQSIIDGDFSAVDLLIGSNNGDGSPLLTKSMKSLFGFFGMKEPKINLTLGKSIIRNKFKNYPDPDAVVRQYLGGVLEDDFYRIRFEVFTALGDYARVCPTVYFAESFARKGAPTYYYFFTHRPSYTPWAPWMLAVHFDETPFVFGYPLRYSNKYTVEERILSLRMLKAWSNFAKTGIPSDGVWPLYSKAIPNYPVLDVNNNGIAYGPHRCNCDFFRSEFGF